VYTRPPSIDDDQIVAFLARWGVHATRVEYRAVGFGSHHWEVTAENARWFLTIDDLHAKRGVAELAAALRTAHELRTHGRPFVVAPIPSERGELVVALDDRYVGALYGYVAGETDDYGEYDNDDDRRAVLRLLSSLHTAPTDLGTRVEDFVLEHRAQLTDDLPWGSGPYAPRARAVLAAQREHVETELARYDKLAAMTATQRDQFVVTHGEPHRANTIRTEKGLVLIDWDTALIAPRERDLWMVVDADSPLLAEYETAVGATTHPAFFALYALQWDLMEVAGYLAFFRADHEDTADAAESWKNYLRFIGAD
jgi:spectinomycin phosphotransferase/16S rRNA (guanine(1405)-N(7))-methyltransferase